MTDYEPSAEAMECAKAALPFDLLAAYPHIANEIARAIDAFAAKRVMELARTHNAYINSLMLRGKLAP